MCRTGELMQCGRHPCDGIVIADKCAACSLTRLGMPPFAARVAGAIPLAVSAGLGVIPGRVGTTLGMAASVRDSQAMQTDLFSLAERVVVLNETALRMLIANGSPADKLALNRLGISRTGVDRKPSPDVQPTTCPVRFLYLGRLHETKGLSTLVRAVVALPRSADFRLDIRGPQLDENSRRYAAELRALAGDDPRVTIGPGVAAQHVAEQLAACDTLLCPSIWFENGPTIALEAMAAGTPVIGSRIGNLAEIIEDGVNGQLVAPGDVDRWSAALARAAADPAGTIDRWRRGVRMPRTMDEVAADYFALYAATPTHAVEPRVRVRHAASAAASGPRNTALEN